MKWVGIDRGENLHACEYAVDGFHLRPCGDWIANPYTIQSLVDNVTWYPISPISISHWGMH